MQDISIYLKDISLVTYAVVLLGGIAASFTPCVFPLIPIIVSLIGARGEKSRLKNLFLSLSYVLGMACTFSVLGLVAALTGKLFGQMQTSPIAHLIVGNVMILFGLSLLDVIHLPFFVLNRAGAGKVVKGKSFYSIFFMGAASGFVAAPCTAAVLGALLAYVATTQNVVFGFTLLFVFAMGLGTLLILIGTFTGILITIKKLDKWMFVIQKVFGFGMILLGEYFVYRAGFLSL